MPSGGNHKQYGLLRPIELPTRTWEHVTLDLVTAPPDTPHGNDACVVFCDRLSKMVHFAPCKKTIDAPGMACLFVQHVIRLHGWPSVVISDRDPRFDSEFWRAVLKGSECQLRMSTPYHPQTDGQTERANRTLLAMLRKFASPNGSNWEDLLPWLEFAYNDSWQSSTGFSPFFLCTGSHPRRPLSSLFAADGRKLPADARQVKAFQDSLDSALELAKSNLCLAQARQKPRGPRTHAFSLQTGRPRPPGFGNVPLRGAQGA